MNPVAIQQAHKVASELPVAGAARGEGPDIPSNKPGVLAKGLYTILKGQAETPHYITTVGRYIIDGRSPVEGVQAASKEWPLEKVHRYP